jgi:hypothetical protein
MVMSALGDAGKAVGQVVRDAVKVSLDLFKIMVPIIIAVKAAKELGLIEYLAYPLRPLMELMGLPASMGLVWATALVNSIYGGIIVYASLADEYVLNVGQVTVLCCLMLVAHNLPVEGRIAQKSGARFRAQTVIRLAGAFGLGVILNQVYTRLDVLQEPSRLFWTPKTPDPSLLGWARGELANLGMIFLIILCLLAMMRVLTRFKVTDMISRVLHPVLRVIGIGDSAATITVIGLVLGLAYGGGLIIHESRSGRLSPRDIFYSLSLMGLAHSLVEDTLLMLLLGAHLSGILWGRLLFSLVAVALLVRVVDRQSEGTFKRLCYGGAG